MQNFKSGRYINQRHYKSFQPNHINKEWLFEDMNELSGNTLKVFKEHFLKITKENAVSHNESSNSIVLVNGQKALKIESYLTDSGHKLVDISIVFMCKRALSLI